MFHRDQILPFLQDLTGALSLNFKFLPPEELWYYFLASFFTPYEDANIRDNSMTSQPLIILHKTSCFELEQLLDLSYGANITTAISVLFLFFQFRNLIELKLFLSCAYSNHYLRAEVNLDVGRLTKVSQEKSHAWTFKDEVRASHLLLDFLFEFQSCSRWNILGNIHLRDVINMHWVDYDAHIALEKHNKSAVCNDQDCIVSLIVQVNFNFHAKQAFALDDLFDIYRRTTLHLISCLRFVVPCQCNFNTRLILVTI